MIFKKNEIDIDFSAANNSSFVSADTVTDRIKEAVNDKLAFSRDYSSGNWLHVETAEELIIEMHQLIKKIENNR